MSDENEYDNDDPQGGDTPNFANLKKQLANAEARATAAEAQVGQYREVLVRNAVELAGFKAGEDGNFAGVTGLLFKEFQQSLTDDDVPSRAAFLALAEQYGVKPEGGSEDQTVAAQIAQMQTPGDQLRRIAQPPNPPANELADRIQQLEADGKWTEAGRLKRQLQAQAS